MKQDRLGVPFWGGLARLWVSCQERAMRERAMYRYREYSKREVIGVFVAGRRDAMERGYGPRRKNAREG